MHGSINIKNQVLLIKLERDIASDISHKLKLEDACSFETIVSTSKFKAVVTSPSRVSISQRALTVKILPVFLTSHILLTHPARFGFLSMLADLYTPRRPIYTAS